MQTATSNLDRPVVHVSWVDHNWLHFVRAKRAREAGRDHPFIPALELLEKGDWEGLDKLREKHTGKVSGVAVEPGEAFSGEGGGNEGSGESDEASPRGVADTEKERDNCVPGVSEWETIA